MHGQAVGAIVQGLGGALLEQFVYDDEGQLLTGSLRRLPDADRERFSAHPRRRAGDKPLPTNPLGAKGAGEGGIIPVGGVIANAVADALSLARGIEPRELPLSPPRVWQLIQDVRSRVDQMANAMLGDDDVFPPCNSSATEGKLGS